MKPEPNTIYCGDCLDVMRRMDTESVDLIVTSPPYNIRNSSGGGFRGTADKGRWAGAALQQGYVTHSDNMPHDKYVAWQRECLTAMMRVLKENGAIFYNHKWRVQDGLLQDRADIVGGFPVRQIIIWHRAGGINFNEGYFVPTYEVIYLICKPDFRLIPKANGKGDVWYIPQEHKNTHPAPFPIELARRCIESTNAQIILDPFMGSGTTAIAAESRSREWIGIEISEKYCDMARKRIREAGRFFD